MDVEAGSKYSGDGVVNVLLVDTAFEMLDSLRSRAVGDVKRMAGSMRRRRRKVGQPTLSISTGSTTSNQTTLPASPSSCHGDEESDNYVSRGERSNDEFYHAERLAESYRNLIGPHPLEAGYSSTGPATEKLGSGRRNEHSTYDLDEPHERSSGPENCDAEDSKGNHLRGAEDAWYGMF